MRSTGFYIECQIKRTMCKANRIENLGCLFNESKGFSDFQYITMAYVNLQGREESGMEEKKRM